MKFSIILALAIFILGCADSPEKKTTEKLTIVCTTGIIADGVSNLVGEYANVQSLMGPGVDPHLYKTTAGDLKKLREADVIFYNGLHLEGKMSDVLEKLSSQKPVFALSDGLTKNDLVNTTNFKDGYDPHIWFDVLLWKKCMKYAGEKIATLDSLNEKNYALLSPDYLVKLDSLHLSTLEKISYIPDSQRVLVTTHDAFTYFGRAYNIEVKALQGISTASEFGLKDITELVNFITERKISSVFVESSVSEKSLLAVIEGCANKGHKVTFGGKIYADALGEKGSGAGTYIEMVKTNAQTIVRALTSPVE